MKALVLDFDGVISDSAREAFLVAIQAYLKIRPESELAQRKGRELYDPFMELMPLGNRAEDYGTALAALEAGAKIEDQESYRAFRATRDPAWLERYHREFYTVRGTMMEHDPDNWNAMMKPFEPFLELLRRRDGDAIYAIATSKDRHSVDELLSTYGVADMFRKDLIQDKEAGTKKVAHLKRLQEILNVEYGEMTFVDDKVNHLDSVAQLGVRCALATWGYNTAREYETAIRRGYLLCALEDAEGKLFGQG